MKESNSATLTAPATTAAQTPASTEPKVESKRLSLADIVKDYATNRLHGKAVNDYLVERFFPMLEGGKKNAFAAWRLTFLILQIVEAFPKHVWQAIAESGNPDEITARIRTQVRAIYREKAKHLAKVADELSTDLDLLYLAVDERQNMPGKMPAAQWVGYFLNVTPDKSTQKTIAKMQLRPDLAKAEEAKPAK